MAEFRSLAIGVFFSNNEFLELLLWGGGFFFVIILLFIFVPFFKARINANINSTQMTFGMDVKDIDRLKEKGFLDEEEMKKVRRAMAKNLVERTKAEQEKVKIPPSAAAALALAEQEALAGKKETSAELATEPVAPVEVPADPAPEQAPPTNSLPEKLTSFAAKSDFELEQLQEAGFLTPEEAALIQEARPRNTT